LRQIYDKTPGLVGEQIKYVAISPDMDSRYLKEGIDDLRKAGIIFPIYSTSGAGLPLITHKQEKKKLSLHENILSVPFYMIHRLEELLKQL
tara:strand:- start:7902 stop:8174 length:273 start_codon:yes stop_codon:yes gene_type:complete